MTAQAAAYPRLSRPGVILGISAQDLREYSLMRALRVLEDAPTEKELRAGAPLEAEISRAIADKTGVAAMPGYIHVPLYELQQQRDLTAASAAGGGYLVETAIAPGDSFLGALRAASVTMAMGVETLDDLTGNITVPKLTAGATTAWLTLESTPATESTSTVGQIAASPKTVSAYSEISRQLMLQTTPGAQRFLLRQLGADVGAAVDAAIINGSGAAGQPLGILGTSGIGSESGASLTWAAICAAIGDVEAANGVTDATRTGWAIAPDAAEIMRARAKATGLGFIMADGKIDGRPAMVSNSVPSGEAVFGDWGSIVVASWGGLQVGSNPFANFPMGIVGLRAIWSCDVLVRQAASFAAVTSIS